MIETMEDYTDELKERINKQSRNVVKFATNSLAVNTEPSSRDLANSTDRRQMALMMMCVDAATAETGSDWCLVETGSDWCLVDAGSDWCLVETGSDWCLVDAGSDWCLVETGSEWCLVETGSDWCLVELVREAAMTVVQGEVIVVDEAWNSVIVAVGSDISTSAAATPVAQLIATAGQVVTKVCTHNIANCHLYTIYHLRYAYLPTASLSKVEIFSQSSEAADKISTNISASRGPSAIAAFCLTGPIEFVLCGRSDVEILTPIKTRSLYTTAQGICKVLNSRTASTDFCLDRFF